MAASYLREKCGFHLAFQGNRPKWSLRWRVGASENEWLHVAKKQTSTSNSWETWRRNLCYWSWRLQQLQITKENKDVCLEITEDIQKIHKSGDLEIQQHGKTQNSNVIMNWGESETIAILRSSDSRGRHPQRAPPWIGHAIRNVCEWTHCIWMAGLCWGARFISSNKNAPNRAPPSPPGGRGLESSWRIACAREWVDGLCVLGCARDWVCASPSKNACRDGEGEIKHKCNTWREAKLMFKASGATFRLRNEADPPWKRRWTWEKMFWFLVMLVLIDTGR